MARTKKGPAAELEHFRYLQPVAKGMSATNANWSVMWLTKKDKIREHWCDNNLQEAIEYYIRLKAEGKKMVTLRCANIGFPPPEKYLPHPEIRERLVKVKGKKKPKRERYVVHVHLLATFNNRGIWWCPYCREFRRFEKQDGVRSGNQIVWAESHCCPMCGISHRDFYVRKYNPRAQILYLQLRKRKRGH